MVRDQIRVFALLEETLEIFVPVIKRCGRLAFLLAIGIQLSSQIFQFYSQMDSETVRMLCALNQFLLTGLLWPTLFILIIPIYVRDFEAGQEKTDVQIHLKKYFSQLVIESLRVLGRVTLTAVLWLVPGLLLLAGAIRILALEAPGWVWFVAGGSLLLPVIYKTFQLYFVPFVVQFSKHYDAGVLDALQASTRLWNSPAPLKNTLVLIFMFIVNGAFQYGLTVAPFWESPIIFTVLLIFLTINEVFCDILIYRLYRTLAQIHGGDLA
ncbi:MAG: hypothetical protein K2X47_06730 [Bdellovibrionales bacterium]|nr:hypothetical protein [Bdellovibrionales bacterium]